MKQFFRRLQYLLNRRRLERELASDMEFHREMSQANGTFGNTLLLREEAREAWGWTWIDRLGQDLHYAARKLRQSPAFTVTAILMLALGIGVNVAAFGYFNLMVLRPLPVRDPVTLLHFQRRAPTNGADNFPYSEVAFFSQNARTLSAVLAVSFSRLKMDAEDKPLSATFVTPNYFTDLGASAAVGRLLNPDYDPTPSVVLSYGFWQSHFGSDAGVVGRLIHLNDKPATVIGVASREFSGLGSGTPDLWAAIQQQPYFIPGADMGGLQMWGRLRRDATPAIAEAELSSLAARLRQTDPQDVWEKETLPSEPGGFALTLRREMYPVLAIVGALGLLILGAACATLGSLMLARGVSREREIAIRISIGAGRARLMRQLFTESLVLASLGSVAGLVLGYLVQRSLMVWTDAPLWYNPLPDWRVTTFAMSLGFAAALFFGLAPSWQIARQRHRATKVRQVLISVQVAASCVLLIVAGLLSRALTHAANTPLGFEYEHVIALDPALEGYSPQQAAFYFDQLKSRLSRIPGVESTSMASNPPLGNRWSIGKTPVAGRIIDVHFNNVDSQFFETMRIPLLRGRSLKRGDTTQVVVSDSLARLQWPSEDPVGKQFSKGTVVGVSGNARLVSPEDSDAVEVYRLAQGDLLPQMVFLIRTSGPSETVLPAIKSVAKSIDPKLFPQAQLLKTAFSRKVAQAGYATMVAGVLGVLAMLLACLGIIGIVAWAVSQRTKEIGIRMALGAKPAHILGIVMRQFSVPVIGGLLLGIGGAAALSQILRQQLYGVSNLDPLAYAAAVGLFVLAAGVAALLPARRALRVDPMLALRYE